jgi:RNA 3'-phosphate cyclase
MRMSSMRSTDFLVIDGSFGEGGGQILRSAIALSALFVRPIRVINIRAMRRNPGLQPQHIAAVKAVAGLCRAKTSELKVGCHQIEFWPQKIAGEKLSLDVGTAGATTLILQSLFIAGYGTGRPIEIELTGGTNVPWSPPIDYVDWVTLFILRRFGYDGSVRLVKRGFYPKGGGRVEARISPSRLGRIELTTRGKLRRIFGISYSEVRLRGGRVAERQRQAALDVLSGRFPGTELEIELEYSSSYSPGSGVVLVGEAEFSRLGSSSLGEKGKRAETVGEEAAVSLSEEISSGAGLDRHMADQIIPYLAIAGGRATIGQPTKHTLTNLEVMRLFGLQIEQRERLLVAEGVEMRSAQQV